MLLTLKLRCAILVTTKGGEHMPNTERIKRRMADIGISQVDLAKALSIAAPTVCQKINNVRPMSLDEAEKIAEVLDIKDEEFGTYFFAPKLA